MKGSIVKRSNKFYIVIDLPRDHTGKRKQKWLSNPDWTTESKAKKALPRILTDLEDGKLTSGKIKYSVLLNQWHESVQLSLRHNSLRSYRWAVNHLNEQLGNRILSSIKPNDIQSVIFTMSKTLSNTSLRLMYAVLLRSFQQAVDWQLIPKNPVEHVSRPSKKQFKPYVYSAEELNELINASRGTFAYLPILIAVSTGMRRSEIAALRWQDIDFTRKEISVRHTITEGGISKGLQPVKTKLSERIIVMPDHLISELLSVERISEFVLGRAYNPSYVWRTMRDVILLHGLPETRFQDLRHAHATYLIMNNVPVKTVSERLGHYSTAFTQDIYGHVLRPMQEKAASVINEMFDNVLADEVKTP